MIDYECCSLLESVNISSFCWPFVLFSSSRWPFIRKVLRYLCGGILCWAHGLGKELNKVCAKQTTYSNQHNLQSVIYTTLSLLMQYDGKRKAGIFYFDLYVCKCILSLSKSFSFPFEIGRKGLMKGYRKFEMGSAKHQRFLDYVPKKSINHYVSFSINSKFLTGSEGCVSPSLPKGSILLKRYVLTWNSNCKSRVKFMEEGASVGNA